MQDLRDLGLPSRGFRVSGFRGLGFWGVSGFRV